MLTRRSVLFGLLAAPAIIKTPGLLMPVRKIEPVWDGAVTGRWSSKAVPFEELPPGTYTGKIIGIDYGALEQRVIARMVFDFTDQEQPRWAEVKVPLL